MKSNEEQKMEEYPWYKIVDNSEPILQGDFIPSCPIVVPPKDIETKIMSAEVIEYDVIIMSQSCDLIQHKIDLVLVCSVWPLEELAKESPFFNSIRGKESLRKGNVTGYHLLNKCELDNFKSDFLVVDFRSVYSIPFGLLKDLCKKRGMRLRLLPPYREHLSQAFARFFMRVGLPIDIEQFRS